MSVKSLLKINKLFKLPVHPFNLQNDGVKSYAMWQYEKGADTIKFYTQRYTTDEMFKDKVVLDVGCGAGGKTMYYASLGAEKVIGMDIVEKYKEDSERLAKELNLLDKFQFICCDAAHMCLDDESVDTIIMNDAMEHVDDPEGVIKECARVLKKGGRLYVNFPPYGHPYGAHLSDLIGMPWVQLFYSDADMIGAYKQLCKTVPDGDERVNFRISRREDGTEYFSYINKMTLKRFKGIKAGSPMEAVYYHEAPLRSFLSPLAKCPGFKEYFVKMAVCVFEK